MKRYIGCGLNNGASVLLELGVQQNNLVTVWGQFQLQSHPSAMGGGNDAEVQ